MTLEFVVSDTGRLCCDNVEIADVEITITVRRGAEGQGRASGSLRGGADAVDACRNAAAVELLTRHFGRVLIQIHRIDDLHAHFDLAESVEVLGIDAPVSPALAPADDDHLPDGRRPRS